MGGRGSSSGISVSGKPYGTEYRTVLQSGNIKFIKATSRDSEMFETKTKGRVYVEIDNRNQVKSIYYFDNNLRKKKSIDLRHSHEEMKPHTHHGYIHNENDGVKGATNLTTKEKKMVAKALKLWYNNKGK